ncbi:uncharacterized protein LOC110241748 isoform X2 [Exaiptasia diaphana]|uniref:Uncharacterized protein n=1 Tax=Exaiptasia diaphana TaxID=2652724 RepID=A0A913XFA8_EXADI|nr:uncharacterized protein LOC110241748 isoform X2 [Exaiptasia diaphana]
MKNRSAVVRYYSDISHSSEVLRHHYKSYYCNWHSPWYSLCGLNVQNWRPDLQQSKPGEVTVNWDPLTLPSKSYVVVPLYNSTAKGEPFLYIIERRNKTSLAVEYLEPATSYTFKVFAFDSTNTGSLIESTTWSLAMKNDTLRLVGGQVSNEGRVEVFKNGSWNKICFFSYRNNSKDYVICRSLSLPSPPHPIYSQTFQDTSFPVHFLKKKYRCNGNETGLEECATSIDTQSMCQRNPRYQAEVVCGHPPVFYQNITKMTGVITSPGYPSSMMQADYRWTFMPNLTHGHVVIYFEKLYLGRWWPDYGYSRVYIQESLPDKVNRNCVYRRLVTVKSLPVQLQFYSSSSTRRLITKHNTQGMRARFFTYSEPVPTLTNWVISLSSHSYKSITANWTQVPVTGYDVLGFLISCNSTQDWVNKSSHEFGESNSTSATLSGLIGYTNYDVHVLALLRKGRNGTIAAYRSSETSITTPESSPIWGPQGLYFTNITSNTAVIGWKEIPRKYTHGEVLGYTILLYNCSTPYHQKQIVVYDTSVVLTDLSPAIQYCVEIRGYTSAGAGPSTRRSFSTKGISVEEKPTTGPPPKPPTPSKEELRNSVKVTIKELNIFEWNQQLDLKFKRSVAHEVTAFCVKNSICLPPKGRKRRTENNFINFTSDQVNLVGFPIQLSNASSGSMNALVAFYVKFPPGVSSNHSDSIDGAILVDIINGSLGNIGKDIGKTLLSVSRYQTQTAVTTESPKTTSSGFGPKERSSMAYIIVGSIGGAIVLIVLLFAAISYCNRRTTKKYSTREEHTTNVEMNKYHQFDL